MMYDIIVLENLYFVRPHVDEKPASLKRCVFGDRFHGIRVDGALMSKRKKQFSPASHFFVHFVFTARLRGENA